MYSVQALSYCEISTAATQYSKDSLLQMTYTCTCYYKLTSVHSVSTIFCRPQEEMADLN